ARFLEPRREVRRVLHPGLPGSPDHERAARWFKGFGAMISFELEGGREAADVFIGALEHARGAPSMGGVATLVCPPAPTFHAGMPAAEERRRGVTEGLVRGSVGLEDWEDLRDDFAHALARVTRGARVPA